MALCSYVERRRRTYYFRGRLPGALAVILGRTHVVGSLLTEARVAKLRVARFFFVLAKLDASKNPRAFGADVIPWAILCGAILCEGGHGEWCSGIFRL